MGSWTGRDPEISPISGRRRLRLRERDLGEEDRDGKNRRRSGTSRPAPPADGDAFRVVYAVQLAEEIWVVHAFQKKSTLGIKTPKRDTDLIKDRLKRLKEVLP